MKRFKLFLLMLLMLLLGSIGITGCKEDSGAGEDQAERLFIPQEVMDAVADGKEAEDPVYQELTLIEDEPEAEAPEETGDEPEMEASEEPGAEAKEDTPEPELIDENGVYDSKEEVALYIHTYGKLPGNYITKKEAQALGWSGGSLSEYAPGKCIGGSYFGNYEQALPEKRGRKYYECDIDTLGASKRGAKRIIYSNDGLIYYTGDHYETFELLYDAAGGAESE